MALAARTAPKGKGTDMLEIRVLAKKDMKKLAARLEKLGKEKDIGFFLRMQEPRRLGRLCPYRLPGRRSRRHQLRRLRVCDCADFTKALRKKSKRETPFAGPTASSAWPTSASRSVQQSRPPRFITWTNRVMYSGGVAARDLCLFSKDCTVVYAIPLSATGKNIFFDRPSSH